MIAVATSPNCVGIALESTPELEAETGSTTDAAPKPLQLAETDFSDTELPFDPQRVLFVPLANRTGRCLHATYLRAFDQTLALHAAAFLGRSVTAPERAGWLARALD